MRTIRIGGWSQMCIVINLSSPNTPGLRDFQAPERMRIVIEAIRRASGEIGVEPPLLIKLAPDLEVMMIAPQTARLLPPASSLIAEKSTSFSNRSDSLRLPVTSFSSWSGPTRHIMASESLGFPMCSAQFH